MLITRASCCFIALIAASCTTTGPYSNDYPLSDDVFHSRDGVLTGKIPQGWFSSLEDTLTPALTAWIVKNDLTASLSLKILSLDRLSAQRVLNEGVMLLAHISAAFHGEALHVQASELKEFEFRGKKYCGYELGDGSGRRRIVVFTARSRFYECEARVFGASRSDGELPSVFSAQQTLLSSLRF